MKTIFQVSVVLGLSLLFLPFSSYAQEKLLGQIDFPTSGDSEAQPHFIEGVLFLHNFEYDDAAMAFRRAQEIDPDFAMAYWGEAKTHNHPIWMQQDREAAMEILERLGPTVEARLEKAPTQREKDYLLTLETLYGNTDRSRGKSKEERDDIYRDEMRRLHESYPDDHEAAAFYALSILGTAHEGRDFATYMQAAAVLQKVWDENEKHPGAAHYLIHSFDDPIHAPLGLPMARVYSEIAPAAAHAQHMTSHIFVAMGMWDDVVRANEIAREVQNTRRVELDRREVVCGHYPYWLEYGYLQQGRFEKAENVLGACYDRIMDEPSNSEKWHFGVMRARYVLDTRNWSASMKWEAPAGVNMEAYEDYLFTDAYAALMQGDRETAVLSHKLLQKKEDETEKVRVLDLEIQGLLALEDGREDKAVELLEKAAAIEAEMPYSFGPPAIVKPSRELLGDVYLDIGRYEEAVAAYKEQLQQTPLRTAALLGLARASRKAGLDVEADEALSRLARIWKEADSGIPGHKEVVMPR